MQVASAVLSEEQDSQLTAWVLLWWRSPLAMCTLMKVIIAFLWGIGVSWHSSQFHLLALLCECPRLTAVLYT